MTFKEYQYALSVAAFRLRVQMEANREYEHQECAQRCWVARGVISRFAV